MTKRKIFITRASKESLARGKEKAYKPSSNIIFIGNNKEGRAMPMLQRFSIDSEGLPFFNDSNGIYLLYDEVKNILNGSTELLLTSEQWQDIYANVIEVHDPDGWPRDSNYEYAWYQERINKQEWLSRVAKSTCRFDKNFLVKEL